MKKIGIVLLIISITLCAVCLVPASYANLLQNGSFENGVNPPTGSYRKLTAVNNSIYGWTVSSGEVDWIYAHWIASDGIYSIDLSGIFAGKIEQTFPTDVNRQYIVMFDMAGNYYGDPLKELEIMAAGQSKIFSFDASSSSSGDMGWRENTWVFIANDINTTLSFRSIENYGSFGPAIDNVSVLEAVSDCGPVQSQNLGKYDTTEVYHIPVWVHIITNDNGIGDIKDCMVKSQIKVLNEDFRAIPGTLGAKGTDVRVQFYLAGVDRTENDDWFTDCYYNNCNKEEGKNEREPFKSLNKDPKHYLNIYTKSPGSDKHYYGYTTTNPWDDAGQPWDGVVINWRNFGRKSPADPPTDPPDPPYDQGRTATHEVGHYLGLLHTFNDGCGSATAPGCYTDGDLICDTNPEAAFNLGCPNPANASCGSLADPIHNYMNYTDHTCMEEYTREQAQRIRCMIKNYRSDFIQSSFNCNQLDSCTAIPSGYGAAYNVLSEEKELLIQTLCGYSDVTVEVGSGKSVQFIWRQGYILNRDAWAWEPYDLTGDDLRYDNWYVGNANSTISVPPKELQDIDNFILAYICTWTGTEWKCGCRDQDCGTRYWQLQRYGQSSSTSSSMTSMAEGGVAEAQTSSVLPPPPPLPVIDSDNDGLPDDIENNSCTDPFNADSDYDGIRDGVEDANHNGTVDSGETNPCNRDTDGDGLNDGVEDANQNGIVDSGETNPRNRDSDGDGMPDGWEVQYSLNPLVDDSSEDADGDGYTNLEEYRGRSDPTDRNSLPKPMAMPWIPLLLSDE